MTTEMDKWNMENGIGFPWLNTDGRPLKFYNTASDADWFVRDIYIDTWELRFSSFDTPILPAGVAPHLATSSYRMLYYAKKVEARPAIRTEMVQDNEGNSWEIQRPVTELFVPDGQGGREWNDTVVTISSAMYDGGTLFCPVFVSNLGGIMLKNHSSVKSAELAGGIVEQIRVDCLMRSIHRPSTKQSLAASRTILHFSSFCLDSEISVMGVVPTSVLARLMLLQSNLSLPSKATPN